MFVLLGMVNYSARFEGCFISQCRFRHRSVYCALEVIWISKGGCEVCFAIRFSQCCARVSVVSGFWCTRCFASPLSRFCSWVLVLLRSDESFFFVEDRTCTWDTQKCVHVLQAFLDIGSTNATTDVPEVLMNEPNFCFQSVPATSHRNAPMLNRPVFPCCVMFCWWCSCFPLCISKVVFRDLSGRPSRFFWPLFDGGHVVGLVFLSCWAKRRLSMAWSVKQRNANRHNRPNRGITFDGGGGFMHRCQPTSGESCGVLRRQHCVKVWLSGVLVHHQDVKIVAENPKTSYFLFVMMVTVFLSIFIRVVVVGALLFVNLVSLSTSSSKLRLRRISWVTGECCLRDHAGDMLFCEVRTTISSFLFGLLFCFFQLGPRLRGWYCVELSCVVVVVSWVQVWSRWKTSCACEDWVVIFLRSGSCVICFCLCIDDVVWSWVFFFSRRQFLKWFPRERLVVLFWHHFRRFEALCSRFGVFSDGWMCFLLVRIASCSCLLWLVSCRARVVFWFVFSLLFAGFVVVFMSMWVVDRLCISTNVGSLISDCFFQRRWFAPWAHLVVCVCFTWGFVFHVPAVECVSMC